MVHQGTDGEGGEGTETYVLDLVDTRAVSEATELLWVCNDVCRIISATELLEVFIELFCRPA